MTIKRILDSRGATVTEFHFDDMTGVSTIRRVADVEPVVEANKILQTQGGDGYTLSRDMKHVAQVDSILYEEWQKEFCRREGLKFFGQRDGRRWKKFLKMKLNDSDNRAWRTSPGTV